MATGTGRKNQTSKTGAGFRKREPRSRFLFIALTTLTIAAVGAGCAVFTGRPVQEMADTAAALRAAREVQADTLAPELFRQASEWYQTAKNEYKLKNFEAARDAANKSRRYAETAEFEAIKSSGVRSDVNIPDPIADTNPLPGQGDVPTAAPPAAAPPPYPYPSPTPTPFTEYDKRKAEEDEAARRKEEEQKKANQPATQPAFAAPNQVTPTFQSPSGPTSPGGTATP